MRRATLILRFRDLTEATDVITTPADGHRRGSRLDIGLAQPARLPAERVRHGRLHLRGPRRGDGAHPNGEDGIAGNMDDYVAGARHQLDHQHPSNGPVGSNSPLLRRHLPRRLRRNVAAAKANFDQIMGGDGSPLNSAAAPNDPNSGVKKLVGLHDWMGFTQSLDEWAATGAMKFKLTFTTYYESALRELAVIRPFRFSVAAFPSGLPPARTPRSRTTSSAAARTPSAGAAA